MRIWNEDLEGHLKKAVEEFETGKEKGAGEIEIGVDKLGVDAEVHASQVFVE
jgi:hypothetical protein